MAISFTLIGVGSVLLFLGLLNGDITPLHDVSKFGGLLLVSVGLVASAVVAAKRRQQERVERLRAGLSQAEPLAKGSGGH